MNHAPEETQDATPSQRFGNLDPLKRQRVLDEAFREFAERGYQQASVNRIVARLGIAKGSLFQYFGSKEGLFRHLFRSAVQAIKKPLKDIRDNAPDEDLGARLRRVLLTASAFAQDHPFIWGIYRRMLADEGFPLRQTLLAEIRREALTYFQELVEDARRRGEVRPDVDPQSAAFVIEAVLDRTLAARDSALLDAGLGLSGDDSARREAAIDAIVDLLRQGLVLANTDRESTP